MRAPESPETPASEVADPFVVSPTRLSGTKIQKDDFYVKHPQRNIQSEWAAHTDKGTWHETTDDSLELDKSRRIAPYNELEGKSKLAQVPEEPLLPIPASVKEDSGNRSAQQKDGASSGALSVDDIIPVRAHNEDDETNKLPDISSKNTTDTTKTEQMPAAKDASDSQLDESSLDQVDDLAITSQISAWDHIARLQSWQDVQQTSTLLAICLAAWTFDLLLPTALLSAVVLAMSPSLRDACFPTSAIMKNRSAAPSHAATIHQRRRTTNHTPEAAVVGSTFTFTISTTTIASVALPALLLWRYATAYTVYKTATALFGLFFFLRVPAVTLLQGWAGTGVDSSRQRFPQGPDAQCSQEGARDEAAECSSHAPQESASGPD